LQNPSDLFSLTQTIRDARPAIARNFG